MPKVTFIALLLLSLSLVPFSAALAAQPETVQFYVA